MKLFFLSVFLLASLSAQAFIGPVNRSTNLEYDGTIKSGSLEKHYLSVKNSHSGTIAAGTVVALDLSDDDGASVAPSTTAGESPLCIVVASCAVGALCKCQNYGIYDSALFDAAVAAVAGKRFYMSSVNAGYIAPRGTDSATEVPGGIFYDASSASGTIQVFINLL